MVLRVVLYIYVLVVHGLRRSMRFGTSLVETTYIVRVGYMICAYLELFTSFRGGKCFYTSFGRDVCIVPFILYKEILLSIAVK